MVRTGSPKPCGAIRAAVPAASSQELCQVVLEIARFRAADGRADELGPALLRGARIIAATPDARDVTVSRCVERPDEYVLLITWPSIEAHEAFRRTEAFPAYRAELAGTLGEVLDVVHVERLTDPG